MEMLTEKQEAFCQAYVLEKNGTQAAIDAGYSPRTAHVQASRLLASSKVRARVDKLLRRQEECAQITADFVLMRAVEVYERCMGAVPVVKRGEQEIDAAGNTVYAFDVKGALSALELIGKHVAVAAFKDRPVEKLAERGVEKTASAKANVLAEQLELPITLSEKERAARVAKILAMAQARQKAGLKGSDVDVNRVAAKVETETETETIATVIATGSSVDGECEACSEGGQD